MEGRPTKIAILGRLPELDPIPANRKKARTTMHYWRRLLQEAGINLIEAEKWLLTEKYGGKPSTIERTI